MVFSRDDSRRAFTDAAEWFVRTAALVGDRWNRPGLGEWDVRALAGDTSRSLLTVETYLARPAAAAEVASATGYFRATRAAAADPAVAARGADAGTAHAVPCPGLWTCGWDLRPWRAVPWAPGGGYRGWRGWHTQSAPWRRMGQLRDRGGQP